MFSRRRSKLRFVLAPALQISHPSRLRGQHELSTIHDEQWKTECIHRLQQDRFAEECLERVISKQQGRIDKMQKIAHCGYNVKEILVRNCQAPDTAEDVLARRYWSLEILNAMQRRKGIQVWSQATTPEISISLEEALGAFDMFVLETREGDISDISARLDQLAAQLRVESPNIEEMSIRQRALEIARFVRRQGLVGVRSEEDYHVLRNRFIGIALFDDEHQALPLISVAIYCCVAQRLGVNAQPCSIPFHVYAIVTPGKGYNLDGKEMDSESQEDRMFMDPFRQDEEVAEDALKRLLNSICAPTSTHEDFLGASSVVKVIFRNARNIANAVQSGETNDPPRRSALSSWNTGLPDMDGSFYGALWSMIIFDPDNRRNYLHHIVQFFQEGFTVDVDLIENTIFPMFNASPERDAILSLIEEVRGRDRAARPITRRTPDTINVKYRVGQKFEHRRYHYEGVIIGWDDRCRASEAWMRQMNIDGLNQGRHQSFYNVLVADKSNRYVAEENINISTHEPSEAMMRLAGKYFKRWDQQTGAFISNIRDEYPDD
ncbi:MAG: hypothetical protein Q9157_003572 [Trypethelium eluteriae]